MKYHSFFPYYCLTLCILGSSATHLNLLYVRCSPVGRHVFVHYCTTFGNAMGVFCLLLHSNIVPQTYIPQSAHSPLLFCAHIFLSIDTMFITDFSKLYAVSQISFSFNPGFVVQLICTLLHLKFCVLYCFSNAGRPTQTSSNPCHLITVTSCVQIPKRGSAIQIVTVQLLGLSWECTSFLVHLQPSQRPIPKKSTQSKIPQGRHVLHINRHCNNL